MQNGRPVSSASGWNTLHAFPQRVYLCRPRRQRPRSTGWCRSGRRSCRLFAPRSPVGSRLRCGMSLRLFEHSGERNALRTRPASHHAASLGGLHNGNRDTFHEDARRLGRRGLCCVCRPVRDRRTRHNVTMLALRVRSLNPRSSIQGPHTRFGAVKQVEYKCLHGNAPARVLGAPHLHAPFASLGARQVAQVLRVGTQCLRH